jgi:hypothetical protein
LGCCCTPTTPCSQSWPHCLMGQTARSTCPQVCGHQQAGAAAAAVVKAGAVEAVPGCNRVYSAMVTVRGGSRCLLHCVCAVKLQMCAGRCCAWGLLHLRISASRTLPPGPVQYPCTGTQPPLPICPCVPCVCVPLRCLQLHQPWPLQSAPLPQPLHSPQHLPSRPATPLSSVRRCTAQSRTMQPPALALLLVACQVVCAAQGVVWVLVVCTKPGPPAPWVLRQQLKPWPRQQHQAASAP